MESKYYTPDISEFHIGFEYEVIEKCSIESGPNMLQWNKKTLTSFGEGKFNWHIKNYPDEFRVKYLDKEDIESLGFVYIKSHPGLNEDLFVAQSSKYNLEFDYDTNYCRIYFPDFGDTTIFAGTVKNKSELKKLLKMLGI